MWFRSPWVCPLPKALLIPEPWRKAVHILPNLTLGHKPNKSAHFPDRNTEALGSKCLTISNMGCVSQRTRDRYSHKQMVSLSFGGQRVCRKYHLQSALNPFLSQGGTVVTINCQPWANDKGEYFRWPRTPGSWYSPHPVFMVACPLRSP